MDMMPMLNQNLGPGQNQTLVSGSWVSPGIWLKVPGKISTALEVPGWKSGHQLPFLIAVNHLPMFCRVINNKEASSSLCWLNNQPRVTFVTQGSYVSLILGHLVPHFAIPLFNLGPDQMSDGLKAEITVAV